MNKDVIYIDVDDDVTAIIGKIKAANEKIVAIVPPKRSSALQSAVNLRLLDRMAKSDKKKIVLITNNAALIALAAAIQLPVAKNLQSKPEVATAPDSAIDESDDIIDGSMLPVGDHASTVPVRDGTRLSKNEAIDSVAAKDAAVAPLAAAVMTADPRGKKSKKPVKVPDFNTFRKKFVLIGLGLAAFIALLIWMFGFAPAATVIITARTSPAPISTAVELSTTAMTNPGEGVLKALLKDNQVDEKLEFEATGTAKVGDKATGTMTVKRTSISRTPISIPAGTVFTSNDISFVSTQAATLAGTDIGEGSIIQDSETIPVQAVDVGSEYNVSARSYRASVGGFSSQGSVMTGGSSREVKVVSEADVERARGELIGRSSDEAKQQLIEEFGETAKSIESSFNIQRGDQVVIPALGQEAPEGKATLTLPTTYSMYGVAKSDFEKYTTAILEDQALTSNQKIYDQGFEDARFSDFRRDNETMTATLATSGKVGPKIDELAMKQQVKGQRYGEVKQTLEAIEGIGDVDVKFSYFWVRTVPNNIDKIDIEFKLQDES
ncbi:hypothetical protein B7Y94_02415 [Candidatus Saccharibacteria bacterium 32-49-12]|nr:MAG: hypothetical protein B7Y94_02415 [Candidatus Saccharibacteria bacterium 32-49-12]